MLYDYGRASPSEIHLASITEADVLASHLVGSHSRLGVVLVSRATEAR
ncbi:MAG TPA: hypothetical protein VGV07_01255 [Devosia sp.]|nr:hypothetical protein [Devosia sp.]HEV2513849.1 hypothetical protein [Devosia sp.]